MMLNTTRYPKIRKVLKLYKLKEAARKRRSLRYKLPKCNPDRYADRITVFMNKFKDTELKIYYFFMIQQISRITNFKLIRINLLLLRFYN